AGAADKAERENKAAERIFGLLPDDQQEEMKKLWNEYEFRNTPEAKFAYALDRLMPLLHNYHTQGKSWEEHQIVLQQVLAKNEPMKEGSEALWNYARSVINESVAKGYLPNSRSDET
ncbi:MAG: HD domain-containing protein, partial [Proteobacteria bacterium]|nr:HD domain-containing protein [Pseudomonadota bacterium]